MIYQLLLTLLLWVRPHESAITRPPQDQTVCEGDNVTITCGFDGIDIIPNWIIDGNTFGNTNIMANSMLYAPNVTNTNDTVLIMLSVTASMNGTRTQCELNLRDPILSSTAVLTIMGTPLRPNLIVTEVALDSFTVLWNTFSHSACGGVIYNIRVLQGLQLIVENITAMNSISFAGLNDTTLYGVFVFATNNAGPGSTMNINVTTLTPAVPSTPRQLKANTLFIDYEPIVWITWTSPLLTRNMTEVEAYNVTLYDKDLLHSFSILQSQTVFNLSEEDVKLNIRETYTISVSAINSVGYSTVVMTTFKLQWLQSATISLSTDNKTVIVTCEVTEASPQAECLVKINCTKCLDSPYTESFRGSIRLPVIPADSEDYVVTVQAVRADNNEPLEEYTVTKILQIPKTSKPSNNSVLAEDSNDDKPIWIYIVIAIAVLIVIVLGILILSIIYCCIMKRRGHSIGYDDEKRKGDINGYTRHSESSTPTSGPVTEKDHHTKNGLESFDNGKIGFYSEVTITNSDKDVTTALPSDPSDSPASIKQESYSQVDMIKKHNKTNYVELGAFNTKQPTVMPMGAPHVKYTEVKIQSNQNKQENSS